MLPARKLAEDAPHRGLTFDAIIRAAPQLRAHDVFIRVPPGPGGEAGLTMTFAELERRVQRLAALLAGFRPPPKSIALIAAPLGAEAMVAALGAMRAGMTPALVPLSASASDLARLIDVSAAPVAIGIDRVGELRPLVTLRDAAVRSFHLRLLAGFGTEMPDGVASLATIFATEPARAPEGPSSDENECRIMVIDNARAGAGVEIGDAQLVEAALDIARALRLSAGARIVTTLVGGDLAAWATSLGAGLLAGLEICPLGLFSLGRLWASLSDGMPVHLVVPGTIEPALESSGLMRHKAIASLIFVHAAAAEARPRPGGLNAAIVDVFRLAPNRISVRKR